MVGGVGPRTGASRGGEAVSVSMSGSRMELGHGAEPSVSLAGPDAVCVCAVFGEPSDGAGQAGGLGKCIQECHLFSTQLLGLDTVLRAL